MYKIDEKILSYMKPIEYGFNTDTYFLNTIKPNKNWILDVRLRNTEEWVKKNGGTFNVLSDKIFRGNLKGFVVQIIFPCYGKRDMKNIMATLY